MQIALIAVMPHYDQLAFAVSKSSGLQSLDDIREKQYPLRLSVRGSQDQCTTLLVEQVLNVHGFGYGDIVRWGGSISYDQPMPPQSPPGGSHELIGFAVASSTRSLRRASLFGLIRLLPLICAF